MTYRTVTLASVERYLECTDEPAADRDEQQSVRQKILEQFPFAVMLELAYPEFDFANRWCWQSFGPHRGECYHCRLGCKPSEYPVCNIAIPHSHLGTWCYHWFVKTDYDFGFSEWYFNRATDRDRFLAYVPSIHWGENYS